APLEARELGGAHVGDDGRHLAGSKLRDRLHVAAVFVAERDIGEQIFDCDQAFRLQHGGARRTDSFDAVEGSGEIHADSNPVYNALVKKLFFVLAAAVCAGAADIRIGIIGTDTSHVPAFTKMLNGDASEAGHMAGARVVAAYKGGSPDIPESANR